MPKTKSKSIPAADALAEIVQLAIYTNLERGYPVVKAFHVTTEHRRLGKPKITSLEIQFGSPPREPNTPADDSDADDAMASAVGLMMALNAFKPSDGDADLAPPTPADLETFSKLRALADEYDPAEDGDLLDYLRANTAMPPQFDTLAVDVPGPSRPDED